MANVATKAHRCCNALNVQHPKEQKTAEGSALSEALVVEQSEKWSKTWKAENEDRVADYSRVVQQYIQEARKSRGEDRSSFEKEKLMWREMLSPTKLRKTCAGFKKCASLGIDFVGVSVERCFD